MVEFYISFQRVLVYHIYCTLQLVSINISVEDGFFFFYNVDRLDKLMFFFFFFIIVVVWLIVVHLLLLLPSLVFIFALKALPIE